MAVNDEVITYYYLGMKDGTYRIMRRLERSRVICVAVGEADTKEEAERKVEYLTMCNEKDK